MDSKSNFFATVLFFNIITSFGFAGSIISWGDATYNEVMNNIPSGDDFVGVTCFADNALALKSDGSYVVWGSNYKNMLNIPVGVAFRDVNLDYGYGLGITPEPATLLLLGLGGLVLHTRI